ncbi:hypothetical protein ZIOFF_029582 [Zingiber officinale]|uniref:Bidirectional sugar transporter SWEET n=1 Tax=Zingiber officinale TaxID=94328 RepID=A0A8J5LB03_ZINOF|nr:hypothetical protein ZIOFF_029582 [Zingiber officinale]
MRRVPPSPEVDFCSRRRCRVSLQIIIAEDFEFLTATGGHYISLKQLLFLLPSAASAHMHLESPARFLLNEAIFEGYRNMKILGDSFNRRLKKDVCTALGCVWCSFVGCLSVASFISMFTSPLLIVNLVIKTKIVEFMPFYLSLSFVYGTVLHHVFIYIQNGIGTVLGIAQLLLYAYYSRKSGAESGLPLLASY